MPHCIMRCLWQEQNARCFEGCELSILEIKSLFFYICSHVSLTNLIDHCNLRSLLNFPPSTLPVYFDLHFFFFQINFSLITTKKKKPMLERILQQLACVIKFYCYKWGRGI